MLKTLPAPNHRGPRLLLAGLLSVGVHAGAIALAGAFPTASPPPAVEQPSAAAEPGNTTQDEPMVTGVIEFEFSPPEITPVDDAPMAPTVDLEEDTPPPGAAPDQYAEMTPVPPRPPIPRAAATRPTRLTTPGPSVATNPGALLGSEGNRPPGAGGVTSRTAWNTPKPPYPEVYRKMRQTGSGSIRIQTDGAGRVISAEMVQSVSPGLDSSTVNFARARWSGPPNRTVVVPVVFELR